MKITQTAKVYAKSLSELDSSIVTAQLPQVIDTISGELGSVLENPSVKKNIKLEIIDDVFAKKTDKKLVNFIKVLVEKDRINLLPEIFEYSSQLYDEANNIKSVEIVSSYELDEETKEKVVDKISKKLNKSIKPKWTVSEDIIAGLVIKYDDTVFDSSLKTRIENLRKDIRSVKWH